MILGKHHQLTLNHLKKLTETKRESFESVTKKVLEVLHEAVQFDSAWVIKLDPSSLKLLNIYLHRFNQKAFSKYLDFYFAKAPIPTISQIKNEGFISKKGSELIEDEIWIENPCYKEILHPLKLHFFLSSACVTPQQEYTGYFVLWRSSDRNDFSTTDCFFMEKTSTYCGELFKQTNPLEINSEKVEILKLVSKRSSPVIIILGKNNDIVFINQAGKNILTLLKSGRIHLSLTEEQRFMEKLYHLKDTVIQTLSSPIQDQENNPICEAFTFRGTTYICRGVPLELKGTQHPVSIMILIETIKEESGFSPLFNQKFSEFTVRERAVANLIGRGLTNKEIASELGIGIHTVKDHVKNIMEKLKTRTRSGIVSKLMEK